MEIKKKWIKIDLSFWVGGWIGVFCSINLSKISGNCVRVLSFLGFYNEWKCIQNENSTQTITELFDVLIKERSQNLVLKSFDFFWSLVVKFSNVVWWILKYCVKYVTKIWLEPF